MTNTAKQRFALTDPTVRRFQGRTFHGNHRIDVPYVTEVQAGLLLGGCTDGLVLPVRVQHVVSLYLAEEYTVLHGLRTRLSVQMYDELDQNLGQVEALARWVLGCWENSVTLVHCQAGLNRSGLVVARTLMLRGYTADQAISLLREKRSPAVLCNKVFEGWLRRKDK